MSTHRRQKMEASRRNIAWRYIRSVDCFDVIRAGGLNRARVNSRVFQKIHGLRSERLLLPWRSVRHHCGQELEKRGQSSRVHIRLFERHLPQFPKISRDRLETIILSSFLFLHLTYLSALCIVCITADAFFRSSFEVVGE